MPPKMLKGKQKTLSIEQFNKLFTSPREEDPIEELLPSSSTSPPPSIRKKVYGNIKIIESINTDNNFRSI